MLRHVSPSDVLDVACEHHYNVFFNIEKLVF